jgi:hypothetical protein
LFSTNTYLYLNYLDLVRSKKYIGLVVVSIIIFNLNYHDALLWAHVSTTYTPVLFFGMLAFYFSINRQVDFKLTLLLLTFCLISSLSFSNGLLTFPPVALIFLLNKVEKGFII